VIIEPASRAELEPVIAAGEGLTAREAETMTLVLRSLPAKTIPRTLPVTLNTAKDHIKAISATAGAGRRGDPMATVLRDYSMPGL
jgi:FixJ family two-component response regulator